MKLKSIVLAAGIMTLPALAMAGITGQLTINNNTKDTLSMTVHGPKATFNVPNVSPNQTGWVRSNAQLNADAKKAGCNTLFDHTCTAKIFDGSTVIANGVLTAKGLSQFEFSFTPESQLDKVQFTNGTDTCVGTCTAVITTGS